MSSSTWVTEDSLGRNTHSCSIHTCPLHTYMCTCMQAMFAWQHNLSHSMCVCVCVCEHSIEIPSHNQCMYSRTHATDTHAYTCAYVLPGIISSLAYWRGTASPASQPLTHPCWAHQLPGCARMRHVQAGGCPTFTLYMCTHAVAVSHGVWGWAGAHIFTHTHTWE